MDLRVWQTLAEPKHEELIRLAAATNPKDVAAVERLRKVCADADLVRCALMLTEARRKAVAKFGAERAAGLWADPAGVEMATSLVVADHKAMRFSVLHEFKEVADLCCGIGGDAMGLARLGGLVAVDRDPVRAWMAERNAGCRVVCADATRVTLPDGPVHIDPARRDESAGARVWKSDEFRPSLDAVRSMLIDRSWGGAIKLGPGADIAEIERVLPGCSIEVISERGRLVQAVAWCGRQLLAEPGERQATLIMRTPDEAWSADSSVTIRGRPGVESLAADGNERYIYEPDDSVERAGLLHVLCERVGAPMLDPRVGLLASDKLIESPWLTAFEVIDSMAWHERKVKAALDALGAGIVEVKTRGKAVDPDVVQRALRGKGDVPITVFVLRFGPAARGMIARRVEQITG